MKHPSSSLVKKDLLFAALRHEETPAIPWVPFAGVHAGSLKGYHARQFLTDGKKLVDALLDVNRQYDPDGQPVVFDLQIEAEILGCELVWAEKATPSVAMHPLAQSMELPACLPKKPMAGCKIRWIGNKSKNGWRYWLPMKALCRSKRWISITTAMPRVKRILPGWIANLASRSNLCRIGSP
jgi:hypothetical protein